MLGMAVDCLRTLNNLCVFRFPKTRIVQLKQEDFRNFKDDQLGMVKNLAQNHDKDTSQAFGARLGGPDAWNAGKCISGEGSLKDVKLDSDLGTTNRYGYRNLTRKGDENRIFGVPTIRNDIVKTSMRSVADPNVILAKCFEGMFVGKIEEFR